MTPYEQSVTVLARIVVFGTFVILVGGWFLALGLRCFYSVRAARRRRRRGGYLIGGFWPPRSDRWFE